MAGAARPTPVNAKAAITRAPKRAMAKATAWAPGTCGELVQGWHDGAHFHVTCPIDLYSSVTATLFEGDGEVVGPTDSPKACRAVSLTLQSLRPPGVSAEIEIRSPIPRGKGMASSTADVAAAIAATACALGCELTPVDIARLAIQVEPSDGLMFPGIALFDHRLGSRYELLGLPPPMDILVLDFGGTVDTLAFNALDLLAPLRQREAEWVRSLGLVRRGLQTGDPSDIGLGASLDSLSYAEVVSRPHIQAVAALAKESGALGVNTAHSGTVMGILFSAGQGIHDALRRAKERLPSLETARVYGVIGGGVRVERAV